MPPTIFEKWASSKGFNLEKKPNSRVDYQDPITVAAFEGYYEGYFDAGLFFWKPRLMYAVSIIERHGLWKEFKDGGLEKVRELMPQELATRSKP